MGVFERSTRCGCPTSGARGLLGECQRLLWPALAQLEGGIPRSDGRPRSPSHSMTHSSSTANRFSYDRFRTAVAFARQRAATIAVWMICFALPIQASSPVHASSSRQDRGYAYVHDEVSEIPWSIHIFKVDRSHREFSFTTSLGDSNQLGMSTVSEQLRNLKGTAGQPLAAVNGDFYNNNDPAYPGDPRDLQVFDGELVSAPTGHACFWIGTNGQPEMTNIQSRFVVTWPDGTTNGFGMNEARSTDVAVLYTPRIGPSTRTSGGMELILDRAGSGAWLPLKVGETYQCRVRSVNTQGNSPVDPETLVMSIGNALSTHLPRVKPGDVIRLATETFPALADVTTAIGGGPTLVRNGKAMDWSGLLMRHPRTAIGWNDREIFLVEVDGRQAKVSAGMTFPELASYMLKLGCDHAMNLDGGGSATLWVRGNVMNSPSEGRERPGANALIVIQRKIQESRE